MRIRKCLYGFICLVLQFFYSSDCFAQKSPSFHFYNITTEDGLSSNLINDITQDSLGYIWIATNDGLNRYDGNNFKVFKSGNPYYHISNNYVQNITIVGNKLYIGTDGGLNIYDIKYESIELFDTKYSDILGNSISALHKRPDANILDIGIYRAGLQHLDLNQNSFHKAPAINKYLSSKEVSSIIQRGSYLYVGTFDDGLNQIDLKTNTLKADYLKLGAINTTYLDRKDNIWIGTRNGIVIITKDNTILRIEQGINSAGGLSDNDVLCFQEDHNGYMWVGTRNGGINLIKMDNPKVAQI